MKKILLSGIIVSIVLLQGVVTPVHAQSTGKDTTYWWNDAVFYEAFVRSFYDNNADGIGDLAGLTSKLHYLNDSNKNSATSLGVDAVWLMPVCPSPSYHGYDISNYKSINPQYGTLALYDTFVAVSHRHDVKVIFDNVINHTSNQHPWFQSSQNVNDTFWRRFYRWYTTNPGYKGPWGEQVWYSSNSDYYYGVFAQSMPDLNYYNQNVQDSVAAVANFWLNKRHVDGFRCDGAPYLVETLDTLENTTNNLNFWQSWHTHVKSVNPNAMAVGEVWMPTSTIQRYAHGQFDFCFEFNLEGDIISALNSGNPGGLESAITSMYQNYPYLQFGTFLSNHDQDRSFDQLNDNMKEAKEGAAILLTFPGIPFIYYGEEVGMTGSGADQNKRSPMQWTAGTNAGFTTAKNPWEPIDTNYLTHNVAVEQADSTSLWNWYRKLIAVRHNEIALRRGTYNTMFCSASSVLSFIRTYKNEVDLVMVNLSGTAYTNNNINLNILGIPNVTKATFTDVLNNYATTTNLIADTALPGIFKVANIPANGTLIYRYTGPNALSVPKIEPTAITLHGYPNPATSYIDIQVPAVISPDAVFAVYDMAGRMVNNITYTRLNSNTLHVDLHSVAQGVYVIRMTDNNQTALLKIVKM